jgi:hypothetical protein
MHPIESYGFARPGQAMSSFVSTALASRWGRVSMLGEALGASLSDFEQYLQTPAFASAWKEVSNQLDAEGVTDLTLAKQTFLNAYTDLGTRASYLVPKDIANAARDFVLSGTTIAGAVRNIKGLVDAASVQSDPIEMTRIFTGTLIGLAAAVAPETAGIGAAIVGFVAGLLEILQAAGLFGGPPQPGSYKFEPGDPIAPGSPNWRHFPDPKDPDDKVWFQPCSEGKDCDIDWRGVHFESHLPSNVNPAGSDMTPIEYLDLGEAGAHFNYGLPARNNQGQLRLDLPNYPLDGPAGFMEAWVAAWKANAAYVFNGLKPQNDRDVFIHFIRMWNRAHQGPVVPMKRWPTHQFDGQVHLAIDADAKDILTPDLTDIAVNAGPLVAQRKAAAAGAAPAQPSAAPVVVTTVALAGAAGGFWLLLGRPMTAAAVKTAVQQLTSSLFR